MRTATVKTIDFEDSSKGLLKVIIDAKDSIYVEPPTNNGFPTLMNSAPLIAGFNKVLLLGHEAGERMQKNEDYFALSLRVKQLLSALDYDKLTDYQAKCVLLLEKQLK